MLVEIHPLQFSYLALYLIVNICSAYELFWLFSFFFLLFNSQKDNSSSFSLSGFHYCH